MQISETEIVIKASREQVWLILSDFDNYHLWNPFCSKLETTKVIGDPVVMTVHMTTGKKPIIQTEILSDFDPPYAAGWKLNWWFLLKTHRLQTLTEIDEQTTRYYTYDKFWGLLTPLVIFLYGNKIQAGFENTAHALKKYAEQALPASTE